MRNTEFNSDTALTILAVALIGLGVVFFVKWRAKRRALLLRAFAERNGFHFVDSYTANLPDFELFERGRSREFNSVSSFTRDGFHVLIGDYQFVEGPVNRPNFFVQTISLWSKTGAAKPHLVVRPKDIFDAVGKIFGGQDIRLEDAELTRAFVIQSRSDEGQVRGSLDTSVREALKTLRSNRASIEAYESALLVHPLKKMSPEEMDRHLADVLILARAWFSTT
jgi:hypothetical protein